VSYPVFQDICLLGICSFTLVSALQAAVFSNGSGMVEIVGDVTA
jgi:hypothetical protein